MGQIVDKWEEIVDKFSGDNCRSVRSTGCRPGMNAGPDAIHRTEAVIHKIPGLIHNYRCQLGEYSFFDGQHVLPEMVVFVDFPVDFAGPVDDGGVVPVAQEAAHLGGRKLQLVD